MSEYKFSCPTCDQHFSGDVRLAGSQIACPNCHSSFMAPPASGPESNRAPVFAPKTVSEKTSGLAIASLVCSCAALLAGPFGAVPGIICGHMAKSRIKRNPALRGRGLATAGLAVGYSMLAVIIVVAGLMIAAAARINKAMEQAALAGTHGSVQKEQAQPKAAVLTDTEPDSSGWTLKLDDVQIPSSPVEGRIHGKPFRAEKVEYESGFLKFGQGAGFFPDLEFSVVLFENDLSKLAGRAFTVPGIKRMRPHIWVKWKEAGQKLPEQKSFMSDYALRLEFSPMRDGKLSGKIYLSVPDAEKSFMRGTFELDAK